MGRVQRWAVVFTKHPRQPPSNPLINAMLLLLLFFFITLLDTHTLTQSYSFVCLFRSLSFDTAIMWLLLVFVVLHNCLFFPHLFISFFGFAFHKNAQSSRDATPTEAITREDEDEDIAYQEGVHVTFLRTHVQRRAPPVVRGVDLWPQQEQVLDDQMLIGCNSYLQGTLGKWERV